MTDPPRRVRFFTGQVLTAADLAADQEYHRGMRHLHNFHLHGSGTATGLEVSVTDGCVHVPVFTRWLEHGEVRLVAADETRPEDVVLARLTGSRRGTVRVDGSVRRILGRD